jgi:hypothetical protein
LEASRSITRSRPTSHQAGMGAPFFEFALQPSPRFTRRQT